MTHHSVPTNAVVVTASPTLPGGAPAAPTAADLPAVALLADGAEKTYVLRFRTGHELVAALVAFAHENHLVAGHLTGLGGVRHALLAYFDPPTKKYEHIEHPEQAELLSLVGNLTLKDDKPFFHLHATLGLRDGSTRGGHLLAATIMPTAEVILTTFAKPIHRKLDPESGLMLLDL